MKISVVVPVGNLDEWAVCERSIRHSINAYNGCVEAEILPCYDLEHRGAYVARNEGLEKALGDWIAWVDCDDMVEQDWFCKIANAIESHTDIDIVQFDAVEVKKGVERYISYWKKGYVSGDEFSHELLRNDGMPAWLWTRVFRRELFEGKVFSGRVKQDYRMFLEILPRIKHVWSIGCALYRYNRTGIGLSNYTQSMDYLQAGWEFDVLINDLPVLWHHDAHVGLALTMADVARHSVKENGSRKWVRRYLIEVLKDSLVPLRLKIKSLLAALAL